MKLDKNILACKILKGYALENVNKDLDLDLEGKTITLDKIRYVCGLIVKLQLD